jgi:L-rhamnose isomerase
LELGEKQIVELCDNVGKMLAVELNSEAVRMKVKRLVADYVNKRDIAADPERLLRKLEWSVKVRIAR